MKNYIKNARLWILQAEQNSELWLQEKAGVLSGSSSTFKTKKDGQLTADAKKLVTLKASERLLGKINKISAQVLDYGHEKEPLAIRKYELRTGYKVTHLGFARLADNIWIGDSPDGLVNYDEETGEAEIVVEVKAHVSPYEFGNVVINEHPDYDKYLEQILHHFIVFNAKEVHHVSFAENGSNDLIIFISVLKREDFEEQINEHFEQCKYAVIEIDETLIRLKENLKNNLNLFF